MPVPEDLEPIWDRVRGELRHDVPDFKFHLWLDPLELAGVQGETLFVRAPDHIRSWVRERYIASIRKAAARGFREGALVEIVDEGWRGEPAGAGRTDPIPTPTLNPKYTFDQFVIGEGNRFAHATALAVAELPGQAFNPLFIHGRPGVGTTHLLQAIGNYVLRYGSAPSVRYSTGEEFTSEFVRSIQTRDTAAFKQRFRAVDVLLLDDIQFLAQKVHTEEELFHTFNVLRESGRQLVMTSDRSPDELEGVEQRLAERFASGVVVRLDHPDLPVRRAILHKRALLDSLDASAALLDVIAHRVHTSVRALEAALIQVIAYASLRGEPPTPELAERLLARSQPAPATCGVAEIVDAAARRFNVSASDVLARGRRPSVARARKVAMYLVREMTDLSLPDIGRAFRRDHSTVLSAIRAVERELGTDPQVQLAVEDLREALAARP